MNKPIRRVAFFALIMFALLLGNVTYSVLFRQASLDANAQNRRTRDAEFAQDRHRGLISGQPVVEEALDAVAKAAMRNSLDSTH